MAGLVGTAFAHNRAIPKEASLGFEAAGIRRFRHRRPGRVMLPTHIIE
jgi:hypothetical protein